MEADRNNGEHERLREQYRAKPESAPPAPWRPVPLHIGGVTAVGFGAGSEWLLVLTHSGLGVVEARTGVTVARTAESDDGDWDPTPVAMKGIGPLAGEVVRLAGLWGGGLRTTSPDGWVLYRVAPSWPLDSAVLCPPRAPGLDEIESATTLIKDCDPPIRALGFSDSGAAMVVATTELLLWSRE